MKKIKLKAFTLIELMAVVLIIGILSIITVAAVNYSIRNAKEKLYAEQIDRLESGVSSWAIENTDLLPNDGAGIVFFSVDRLKDEGIVDSELIIDPRTNEELTGCMTIEYNDNYKQYEYIYKELSCESVSGGYLPVITIVNGTTQYLEVNTEYSFPTATAVDYTGRSIAVTGPIIKNSSNQIVTSIDSSIVGSTYTLSYSSTDENIDLIKVENVTLTIRDTVAPTITCGTSAVSYSVNHPAGPGFVPPTCVVKDNSCGISGTDTNVNGCINTLNDSVSTVGFSETVPSSYPITYTATDSSLNTKVFTVTVVVQDVTPPVVWANNASSTWYASRTATITATDNVAVYEVRYSWNSNPMNGTCTSGGTVVANNTAVTVPVGSNRLYLCARDLAGYAATWDSGADQYRVDIDFPVLTISGANPYEINVGDTFVEPGRSATDNSGVTPTITNTAIPSTATNGSHVITYTATDQSGNSVTATRDFYVWSNWSSWTTTNPTNASTRDEQVKTQYSYRDVTGSTCNTCTYNTTCATYNNCTHSDCGSGSYCNTCTWNTTCNTYNSCRNSSCTCSIAFNCRAAICGCEGTLWCTSEGACRSTYGSPYTICGRYSICANQAACGCEVYNYCRHSSCGCQTYNTASGADCGRCGTTYYTNTCRTAACGCQTYNTATGANCGACGSTNTWGSWSAWQDTAVTASGTREVQTQLVYRYRDR